MGFSKKKAMKGADTAASGLEDQAKARTAAFRSSADDDMSSVRKSMSDNTSSRVAAGPKAKSTFGEAFRAARAAAIKAGRDPDKEIFTWGGQKKVARMASSPSRSGTGSAVRPAPRQEDKPITVTATRDQVNKAKQSPAPPAKPQTAAQPKPPVRPRTLGERMGSSFSERAGNTLIAPFKAAAMYNPLSLAARAILDGGSSRSDDEGSNMKKGGKVKKYAKGGSIDGAAIRGKTRMKRTK